MKKTHYAVKVGRNQGIYKSWDECAQQVEGYPRARFKGFGCRADAEKWLLSGGHIAKRKTKKDQRPRQKNKRFNPSPVTTAGPSADLLYEGDIPPWEFPTYIRCVDHVWEDSLDYSAPGLQKTSYGK